MIASEHTWTADWAERVRSLLHKQGFETVADFLKQFPGEPYVEVVKRIAPWVAAMQLERLQMQEARRRGTLRDAAIDSLSRNLNWLPNGWVMDSATESRAAGACANTSTSVTIGGQSPEYRNPMREVYKALKDLEPPIGWRPSGPDDPRIREAFAGGWPASKGEKTSIIS